VLGLETTALRLRDAVTAIAPGEALAIVGPHGSGRTTLARRLGWTLGVEGRPVAAIEAPRPGVTPREGVELELGSLGAAVASGIIIVDDAHILDDAAQAAIKDASARGARIVAVASRNLVARLASGTCQVFEVPALDSSDLEELVRRAMPSLPNTLLAHLLSQVKGTPGRLRALLKQFGGRPIVSKEDIDVAMEAGPRGSHPPPSMNRDGEVASTERVLDMGRIDEASTLLGSLGEARSVDERVKFAIFRARMSLGRGDPKEALDVLAAVSSEAARGPLVRAWKVAVARAHLRSGDHVQAAKFAGEATDQEDALAADALAVQGFADALTGHANAQETLNRAVALARKVGDRRVEAVALGAMAIVHQRAGKTAEARTAYEESLAAAEDARDAATVALTRLNLAALARAEGDLAQALVHLEAAVDMGQRAGGLIAVQGALLSLANLDLYLGRYARARGSIDSLAKARDALAPIARATLLGLEAELAARTGDVAGGAILYEKSAAAWDAQDRPLDAAESRLEALLARARDPKSSHVDLGRELAEVRKRLGSTGFREHEALAGIVQGAIALLDGDELKGRAALDQALEQAQKAGRREWAWLALEARARLAAMQGHMALARRDVDAALAILEETAAKLPRDLREVFWDDPRRRALRQANLVTIATASQPPPRSSIPLTSRSQSTLFAQGLPAEDRLARIFEITRELAMEHDITRLLSRVTDHAIALLGAERGFVVLAKEDGELEAHAARDRKGELAKDPHVQFSRSVAEKVVKTGEAVIATSARDDSRLAQAVSVHQLMIQSIACVPIRGAPPIGRTIGALYLETRLRPGARFEEELPTLAAFADQAAIAIENARLLSENHERAEELARANVELAAAHGKLSEILGRRTEQLAATRRDLKEMRAELRGHFGYAGLVGTSAPMRKLYALIERIKDTDVPVLITGESGTGKEVVAKAVHGSGSRAKGAFLGVNCGAIPANLLESELFGHVRGAFTGAERDRKGLFREAEGGTLLLDEIGEMPQKMQASLLRVLQESAVRPVGGAKEEKVDVRVIAATNRDLAQMVADGTFREDLYYRLHVVEMHVPPLRQRSEDIPPLMDHFLTLFAARYRRERKSVEREALRRLCAHDWPGNVRQLEHVLLNAWLMGEGSELVLEDFELPEITLRAATPAAVRASVRPSNRPASPAVRSKEEFKDSERERILGALAACNWNRVQAARMIGVPRRTFYRRLKEFGIL
jgi:serine/threonine-protein kinase PknK